MAQRVRNKRQNMILDRADLIAKRIALYAGAGTAVLIFLSYVLIAAQWVGANFVWIIPLASLLTGTLCVVAFYRYTIIIQHEIVPKLCLVLVVLHLASAIQAGVLMDQVSVEEHLNIRTCRD